MYNRLLTTNTPVYTGILVSVVVIFTTLNSGCSGEEVMSNQVWAINVGGDAYIDIDGVNYDAESHVEGGDIGTLDTIKGSQAPVLYQTYRRGDVRVTRPMDNGVYDITFYFAEPDEVNQEERVFDIFVQGQRVAQDTDVMLFRDGKIHSALTVTVPGVAVSDRELTVHFEASRGEPILSALLVRAKVPPQKDKWELVWSDEFDSADGLDLDKWNIEEWPAGKVNDENQAYTSRPSNVRVEDGMLVLEAHKEAFDNAEYTSGRIQSSGKGDFLYGRFEIRAKLPRGQGTWPAIWMLPSNPFTYATTCEEDEDWQGSSTCDAWPNSGEIDIMEHVGYQMNHVHGTVHTKAYYWVKWEQRKGRILVPDVADDFHVYALEWSPEKIDVFMDDTLYFTYINEQKGWEEWPFDQPFHVILNIAVGGVWGRAGGPIDDTIFPQRMLVDYVRVYQTPED